MARSNATSADEHAVSTSSAGPRASNEAATRPGNAPKASPNAPYAEQPFESDPARCHAPM